MSLLQRLDSPVTWAVIGFAVGIGLGVNSASAWLVAGGIGAALVYLHRHGEATRETEGRLFSSLPVLIMSWTAGFMVHGWAF